MISYFKHRWLDKGPIRLVMTYMVKNEVDIIEDNIRFHAAQGVDAFIVCDNGSVDGTVERIEALQQSFEIMLIHKPSDQYLQTEWRTEMAFLARQRYAADWVISSDADEFWMPKSGDLKTTLDRKTAVRTYKRFNMALSEQVLLESYHYTQADLKVINPIAYDTQNQLEQQSLSMLLTKISPKVMVNPYGLINVIGGNHRASHWMAAKRKPVWYADIEVIHYPIRSYEQFEANIANRAELLKSSKNKMGYHYKRWVKAYLEDSLPEEFQKMILNESDVATLVKLGVVEKTSVYQNQFQESSMSD